MPPYRQIYKEHALQVLGHPQTRVEDRMDYIWFKLDMCQEDVVVKVTENKLDYYAQGVKLATLPISRALVLVAIKRAVEESLLQE